MKEEDSIHGSDDASLFLEAMKDVKRISQAKKLVEKEKNQTHTHASDKSDPQKLLEEALRNAHNIDVANLPEYMEGHVEGLNPFTIEKLRNGEFSIRKTLDLHGYSIESAEKIFEDFIKEAIISGMNCVRIIHGRGLKSKQEPVLKESLKRWIVRAMHRKWVVAFSSCKMSDGGPGATYILLRKRPDKKKMRIMG